MTFLSKWWRTIVFVILMFIVAYGFYYIGTMQIHIDPPEPVITTISQTRATRYTRSDVTRSSIPTTSTIFTSTMATTTQTTLIPETTRAPQYGFSDDDIYLMTVVLSGSKHVSGDGEYDIDYGNQDRQDQISLVLGVIMNRVRSNLYPDTVSEVIWQRGQFAVMKRWKKTKLPEVSDESLEIVREWCNAYDHYESEVQIIPKNHLYFWGDGKENHSYAKK